MKVQQAVRVRATQCPRCGNQDLEREDNPADGVQCLECAHHWVEELMPTPRQVGILRHALGLKEDGTGRSHRAHFVTGPGSDDFDDCEALVRAGAMSKRHGSQLSGGDPVYIVTDAGAVIAKSSGGASA